MLPKSSHTQINIVQKHLNPQFRPKENQQRYSQQQPKSDSTPVETLKIRKTNLR